MKIVFKLKIVKNKLKINNTLNQTNIKVCRDTMKLVKDINKLTSLHMTDKLATNFFSGH